jgi:hypothetical protein
VFKKKIIMKKTYKNPTMYVVKVELQQMVAASGGFGSGTKPGGNAVAPEMLFEDDIL